MFSRTSAHLLVMAIILRNGSDFVHYRVLILIHGSLSQWHHLREEKGGGTNNLELKICTRTIYMYIMKYSLVVNIVTDMCILNCTHSEL